MTRGTLVDQGLFVGTRRGQGGLAPRGPGCARRDVPPIDPGPPSWMVLVAATVAYPAAQATLEEERIALHPLRPRTARLKRWSSAWKAPGQGGRPRLRPAFSPKTI
jgi:hypothetical protein